MFRTTRKTPRTAIPHRSANIDHFLACFFITSLSWLPDLEKSLMYRPPFRKDSGHPTDGVNDIHPNSNPTGVMSLVAPHGGKLVNRIVEPARVRRRQAVTQRTTSRNHIIGPRGG